MSALTLTYVLLTGVYVVISYFGLHAIKEQGALLKQAAEAATEQASIASSQFTRATIREVYETSNFEQQLKLARENTALAKQSADALVGAQAAWIMVELGWPHGVGRVSHSIQADLITTGLFVDLICHNKGQTLAWVMEKRITMAVVEKIPPEPNLEAATLIASEPEVFGPSWSSTAKHLYVACEGTSEGKATIVYGVVRYFDIFERKRETTFGYELTSVAPPTLERIPIRAYNRTT